MHEPIKRLDGVAHYANEPFDVVSDGVDGITRKVGEKPNSRVMNLAHDVHTGQVTRLASCLLYVGGQYLVMVSDGAGVFDGDNVSWFYGQSSIELKCPPWISTRSPAPNL
jgi:hypothetical protein